MQPAMSKKLKGGSRILDRPILQVSQCANNHGHCFNKFLPDL